MNIQKMMQQAQQMQESLQKQLKETTVEATAGGGMLSFRPTSRPSSPGNRVQKTRSPLTPATPSQGWSAFFALGRAHRDNGVPVLIRCPSPTLTV